MNITVENLPILFLMIVGLGMVIVLIGIIRLANQHEDASTYTSLESKEHSSHLEDLFSFFLQEEEKKNQNFREMVMDVSKQKVHNITPNTTKQTAEQSRVRQEEQAISHSKETVRTVTNSQPDNELFSEIMKRYEAGEDVETIAKDLKKGTGEVKLIISLYSMR